jgi:hypothetical protein
MNRLKEFLKELSELTKKYELKIDGCGCCHSPWIWDIKNEDFAAKDLIYDEKAQKYKPGDEDE